MNIPRLQGLALILSAVSLLIGLLGPQTIGILGPQTTMLFLMISVLLFILGIPAIHSVQPTGWIGLAGIVLLELGALIALGFRLNMVAPSSFGDNLALTSAIAGMLGSVIIGWLTIREHVFPAWVGWGFLVFGLLNLVGGPFNFNNLAGVLVLFMPILQAVVLFAYGYMIVQKSTGMASNSYEFR